MHRALFRKQIFPSRAFGVVFLCLAVLGALVPLTPARAVTSTINYQGKLTTPANVAVANGQYNMRFWLLTSPSIATTSAVWTETLTGSNRVPVTNGLFSIMLGSTTPLTGVDFTQTLYLGVEIGGTSTPVWDGEMLPRKILGTVPAAFEAENAQTLDGIATSSFLRSDEADTASGLLTFTGGFISSASSTITNLTTSVATTTTLVINGQAFTNLLGLGLTNQSGILTVSTTSLGFGTLAALNSVDISSHTNLSVTATGLTLSGDAVALAAGYTIPLTASTTEWHNKVSSQWTTNGSSIYYNGGNVGIGTASPSEKFEVATGSIRISQSGDYILLNPSDSGVPMLRMFNNGELDGQITVTNAGFGLNAGITASGMIRAAGELVSGVNNATAAAGTLTLRPASGNAPYISFVEDAVGYRGLFGFAAGSGDLVYQSGGSGVLGTGTERLRVTASGDIGVGTSSPLARLDVYGSGNNPAFRVSSSTNATMFTVNADGRVGIGTTTLGAKLQITPNASSTTGLVVQGDNNQSANIQEWQSNLGSVLSRIRPSGDLEVVSGSVTTLANGNWLIRDSSNNGLANNFGGVGGVALWSSGSVVATAYSNYLSLQNNGVFGWSSSPTAANPNAGISRIGDAQIAIGNGVSGDVSGTLVLGAIGVGTSSPLARLDVYGAAGNNPAFRVSSSTNATMFTVNANGNVGIGTTTPETRVVVQNSGGADFMRFFSGSGNNYRFQVSDSGTVSGGAGLASYQIEAGSGVQTAGFGVQNTVGAYNYSGAFGRINTIGADEAFAFGKSNTVSASFAAAFGLGITNSVANSVMIGPSNTAKITILDSGNVGIGTTSPLYELDIATGNADGIRITSSNAPTLRLSTDATDSASRNWAILTQNFTPGDFAISQSGSRGGNPVGGSTPIYISPARDVAIGGSTAAANLTGATLVALATGNVGIGTTTPSTKLDVAGNLRVGAHGGDTIISFAPTVSGQTPTVGTTYASNFFDIALTSNIKLSLQPGSTGTAFQWANTVHELAQAYQNFTVHDGGPGMRLTATGLGVGTTTTAHALTVVGDTNITGALRMSGNAGTSGYVLQSTGSAAQWVATSTLGLGGSGAATFLALTDTPSSYTANRIFFTNSGATAVTDSDDLVFTGTNLGVGTTSPLARLDVYGAAGTSPAFRVSSSTNATMFTVNANGRVGIGTSTPTSLLSVAGNTPAFSLYNTAGGGLMYQLRNGGAGTGRFDIFDTSANESRFTIDSNGHVAMGTSTTINEAKLFVYGGANVDIRAATDLQSATLEVQAHDFDTNFQSAYLQYIGSGIAGNAFGSIPNADLARIVFQEPANAAIYTTNSAPIIFGLNGAEVARFSSSNLGLGTTTPGALLTVAGTSSVRSMLPETNLAYSLGSSARRFNEGWISTLNVGTSTWSMTQSAGGRFSLFDAASGGGNERLSVLTNGSVGIGTTTPLYPLSVSGVASADMFFSASTTASSTLRHVLNVGNSATAHGNPGILNVKGLGSASIGFDNDSVGEASILLNNSTYGLALETHSLLPITFRPYGATGLQINTDANTGLGTTTMATGARLTVEGSAYVRGSATTTGSGAFGGNLIVGTTSPIARLHVQGSTSSHAFLISSSTSAFSDMFVVNSGGNVGINKGGAYSGPFNPEAPLHIVGYNPELRLQHSSADGAIRISFYDDGGENSYIMNDVGVGEFRLATPNTLNFGVVGTERLTITSMGNVGIGTTSPTQLFSVAGNTSAPIARFSNAAGNGTTVDIGAITGSGAVLYVNDAGNNNAIFKFNGSYAGSSLSVYGKVDQDSNGAHFNVDTGGVTRFLVNNAGNVGIGTTSPLAKLDVYGTAGNSPAFRVSSSTNATMFTVNANGRVGIGTSTPLAQLHVSSDTPGLMIEAPGVGYSVFSNAGFSTVAGGVATFSVHDDGWTNIEAFGSGRSLNLTSEQEDVLLMAGGAGLIVKNGGHVGIGTTSPMAKFTVDGGSLDTPDLYTILLQGTHALPYNADAIGGGVFIAGGAGSSGDEFTSSGVGGALVIQGGQGGDANYTDGVGASGGSVTITGGTGGYGQDVSGNQGDVIIDGARVFINANTSATCSGCGYVGLGTLNPDVRFEVVGDILSKGTTWSTQVATSTAFQSVTYGNGLFVAVASTTGVTNQIFTSSDGVNWTMATSPVSRAWTSVTYGNGLFVAVEFNDGGSQGRSMISSDGVNWTAISTGLSQGWTSVTYGNGLFVAVACNSGGESVCSTTSTDRVMTSPDGVNWTTRSDAADIHWRSVTYGNGLFVAVASSGSGNRVMTSPDGITWTSRTSAADNSWQSVTYGNGRFVAVASDGSSRVMISTNGTSWTSMSASAANSWQSVTYGNGLFVAVADSGSSNRVMTSVGGSLWRSRTSAADNSWQSVTYGNGRFVAVADSGSSNRVMTSGLIESNALAHNNIFQGGTSIMSGLSIGTSSSSTLPFRVANNTGTTLLINASGNIGIGTTTPLARLDVHGLSGSTDIFGVSSSTGSRIVTVSANGRVGIGTTSPQKALHVQIATDDAPVRFQDSNGYCEINPTSATWTCTSDQRLKDNIKSLDNAVVLRNLEELRPVSFAWKSDMKHEDRIGLIAQEVEEVFPDLVVTDRASGFKSVSYGGFITYLIAGLNELGSTTRERDVQLATLLRTGSSTFPSMSPFAALLETEDSLWSRLVSLAQNFVDGVLTIAGVRTNELCVGSVCVDEATFLQIVEQSGGIPQPPDSDDGSEEEDPLLDNSGTSTDASSEEEENVDIPLSDEDGTNGTGDNGSEDEEVTNDAPEGDSSESSASESEPEPPASPPSE
jgi:hypothetical protein